MQEILLSLNFSVVYTKNYNVIRALLYGRKRCIYLFGICIFSKFIKGKELVTSNLLFDAVRK